MDQSLHVLWKGLLIATNPSELSTHSFMKYFNAIQDIVLVVEDNSFQ